MNNENLLKNMFRKLWFNDDYFSLQPFTVVKKISKDAKNAKVANIG